MALYSVLFLLLPFLGILRNSEAGYPYNPNCGLLLKTGNAVCKDLVHRGTFCKLDCPGEGMNVYRCSQDRGWQVQLPACFTDFKAYPSCALTVKHGVLLCEERGDGVIDCSVSCDGRRHESHYCSKVGGWNETLPECISGMKANSQCSLAVRNGSVVCQDVGRGDISCTVLCDSRPTHGFYRCSQDQGWNRVLPLCVAGFRDSMCNLNVKNGAASCQVEGTGEIVCNVLCDRQFQGAYRCTEGRGWDKKLPPCVN
ncbi:unnamed protein product [Larinioides sclopetarius]|uniref:Uncharacterized protein n=1 Tax=Larinioides sclopetarius TaxID=280406 RepID=A0AAV2BW59_9ARAC